MITCPPSHLGHVSCHLVFPHLQSLTSSPKKCEFVTVATLNVIQNVVRLIETC